jgi:hypothetical protein
MAVSLRPLYSQDGAIVALSAACVHELAAHAYLRGGGGAFPRS